MGCCQAKPAPEPAAKPQPQQQTRAAPTLTQEQRNEIAVQALKDALRIALDDAIQTTSDEKHWDAKPVDVPFKAKSDELVETVKKVPLVGGALAKGVEEKVTQLQDSLGDAAHKVSKNTKTKAAFTDAIEKLTVEKAIDLVKKGSSTACVDYLDEASNVRVRNAVHAVADEALKGHEAARDLNTFKETFNSAAAKVPGGKVEPIDMDLEDYTTDQAHKRIVALMKEKEAEIRKAPSKAVNKKVAEVFGLPQDQWTA